MFLPFTSARMFIFLRKQLQAYAGIFFKMDYMTFICRLNLIFANTNLKAILLYGNCLQHEDSSNSKVFSKYLYTNGICLYLHLNIDIFSLLKGKTASLCTEL